MTNIKRWTVTSAREDVDKQELYIIAHLLWKAIWQLLYDQAVLHLDIYPREMKTYVHTKTCTQMFKTSLFIITEKWKQVVPITRYMLEKLWSDFTHHSYIDSYL